LNRPAYLQHVVCETNEAWHEAFLPGLFDTKPGLWRPAATQAKDFMLMGSSLLADRGVVKVIGGEAKAFLHRLVTNNVLAIQLGEARYAALLTPQGKLMFDFLVVPVAGGPEPAFYLDCPAPQVQDLAKRLNLHKLRAKITIEDLSATLGVAAFWGEAPPDLAGTLYTDPRAPGLGSRLIASHEALAKITDANDEAYEAHRISLGVAKGGVDFPYGDTFIHDANLDLLHGVDFKKGCYVGQEVVARVHYRKSARKRIVTIHFEGAAPAPGTEILAEEMVLGHVGSSAGSTGLAMLRLDRLEDARAKGATLIAGGAKIDVTLPAELLETAGGAG
jgi:tRNA-modifying protein YgfZ